MRLLRRAALVWSAALGTALCPAAAQHVSNLQTTAKGKTPGAHKPAPIVRAPAPEPLSARERATQLLDRFSYGPRPGDVDRLLAMGAGQWLEAQLHPATIPDGALARRLGDFPTLSMSPAQALGVFPDRPQIRAVAEGRVPMPSDALQRAVFEVQVSRWRAEQDRKNPDASAQPKPELSEAEQAAQKRRDQLTAARIAGELLVLPKEQRMAALLAMPVEDRVIFSEPGNLLPQTRNLLLAEAAPRERETLLAMGGRLNSSGQIAEELAQAHILRDILSRRQLEAVMTDFWFNHLNVFAGKDSDQWYTTSYERDVIRPHALGKFRDLLLATATSPAMLVYLDNWTSVGPDSLANGVNPAKPNLKRGGKGLNENYGREVMELHTIGANGGYTQADVTSLAAILTGWTVDGPQEGGGFVFEPRRHQPGAKTWFGYCIGDDGSARKLSGGETAACGEGQASPASAGSMQQGIAALKILADSPQCAHFISFKLAQYFVADEPPAALVDRLSKVYLASDGDISTLLRAIVESPEFNSRQYFHTKVKTPVEFLASAFRATGTEPQNAALLVNQARTMGMPLYRALPPTGYYLTADQWMNSTALVDRLNFAYQLTSSKLGNQRFDGPRLLAQALLATPSLVAEPSSVTPVNAQKKAATTGPLRMVSTLDAKPSVGTSSVSAGSGLAIKTLEGTVLPIAVSPKTHALVTEQVSHQPPDANVTDTLNLITGLLLGSPEFQLR